MEIKPSTDLVNRLVEQSFGRGWKGNCLPSQRESGGVVGTIVHTGLGVPMYIAKRKLLSIPLIFDNFLIAGRFASEDGSRISIFPEYMQQAQLYSELYQSAIGKPAEIEIMN